MMTNRARRVPRPKPTLVSQKREIDTLTQDLSKIRKAWADQDEMMELARKRIHHYGLGRVSVSLHLAIDQLVAHAREEGFKRAEKLLEPQVETLATEVSKEALKQIEPGMPVETIDKIVSYTVADKLGKISPRVKWLIDFLENLTSEELRQLLRPHDLDVVIAIGAKLAMYDQFPSIVEDRAKKPPSDSDKLFEEWGRLQQYPNGTEVIEEMFSGFGYTGSERSISTLVREGVPPAVAWDRAMERLLKERSTAASSLALQWLFVATHPDERVQHIALRQWGMEKPNHRVPSAHEIATELRSSLFDAGVPGNIRQEASEYAQARWNKIVGH